METRKSKLQQIRDGIIAEIKALLEKHSLDELDITYCGSTPVIWPSADDQDFDTYTLDRVYAHGVNILVDSSSSDNNRTDNAMNLDTDTLVNILEFLEDNEGSIWEKVEDAAKDAVLEEYHKQDNCMGDFLSTAKIGDILGPGVLGMTFEDLMQLYCDVKNEADGDEFFRENSSCGDKGERKNLITWDSEPLKKPVFVLHQVANNDGVNDCCVVNVYTDKSEAEAKLKEMRDTFVKSLGEDDGLETLEKGYDTLTDNSNFFCYYKFDTNRLFQLEVVESEI